MNRKQAVVPEGITLMGPYSAGVVVGETVWVAGQGPLDAATGRIAGDDIETQTKLTLRSVQRILEAAGCTLDDCVKTTVHLSDIRLFDRFNVVYRKFFQPPYPARTTVQSVLWGGILVEIDAVAVKGCGGRPLQDS